MPEQSDTRTVRERARDGARKPAALAAAECSASLIAWLMVHDGERPALGRYVALRVLARAIAAGEMTFPEAYAMAVDEMGMPAAAWYANAAPRRLVLADVITGTVHVK